MACGFVFDCDGTLMNTIQAWHAAEEQLMSDAGIVLTKRQRDELNTLTLEEASVFFYEGFGVSNSPDGVRDLIVDHLLGYYRTQAEPNPGVMAFVQALHAAAAPLCVLSSSPQLFLQTGLGRAGLIPYFQDILSVEDIGIAKRDPRAYEQACALLGTKPSETWFFDDSWYALKAAREAGLRTVGVFSEDECGTHGELARYSELVVDDFTGLSPERFLACA